MEQQQSDKLARLYNYTLLVIIRNINYYYKIDLVLYILFDSLIHEENNSL